MSAPASLFPVSLTSADLSALGVELTLTAGVVAILIGGTVVRGAPNRWPAWVAAVTMLVAFLSLSAAPSGTFCSGMVVMDGLARFWKVTLLVAGLGIVIMEAAAPARPVSIPRWTLILGAMAGFSLSASTGNLLLALLALETSALSGYVLTAVGAGKRGNEAGLKLAILGSAATAVMVLGFALAAGSTGSLELADIAAKLAPTWHAGGLAVTATALVCVGFAFKLAAVPFHTWAPDVMEGGDATAAAMLSMLSKGAVVTLAVRWLGMVVAQIPAVEPAENLAVALAAVSVLTMTFGNLGALRQKNFRRMLGYSSIAQSGYLLAGLAGWALAKADSRPAVGGAVLVMLISYMPAALAAFAMAAAAERSASGGTIRAGATGPGLSGVASRHPWAAGALAVAMISLIGLPPAVGVVGKTVLLVGLSKAGGIGFLTVVQGALLVNTIISAVYYLNVVRAMYTDTPVPADEHKRIDALTAALTVTCALLMITGLIAAGPLVRWATAAF